VRDPSTSFLVSFLQIEDVPKYRHSFFWDPAVESDESSHPLLNQRGEENPESVHTSLALLRLRLFATLDFEVDLLERKPQTPKVAFCEDDRVF
jgi:hypothetical protein